MLKLDLQAVEAFLSREAIDWELRQQERLLQAALKGEEPYRDSLGWLRPEEWASNAAVEEFRQLAEEIRREADVLVLIGVGGSNNAARATIQALCNSGKPQVLYAGTSTSAYPLNQVLEQCEGKSVYTVCIAKNFETLEPGISFRVLREYLRSRYGADYARRIVTIGTIGSHFDTLSAEHGFRFLPFATNIGGRFTALSSVGLLPMAVAGVDIREVVRGAEDLRRRLIGEPAQQNVALRYAVVRNLLYQKGYRVEMLSSFEPQLQGFYRWWRQLFAESEGKDGRGIYPTASEYSEDLHSVGQYIQDGSRILFETFLDVETPPASHTMPKTDIDDQFAYLDGKDFAQINRSAFEATFQAHSRQAPCMRVSVSTLDAYHMGQLFYFFEFACYLSGRILGVNPFDQPGVEAYKQLMFQKLGKS